MSRRRRERHARTTNRSQRRSSQNKRFQEKIADSRAESRQAPARQQTSLGPGRPALRGRVIKNPRGFAFVILDPPIPGIDEDVFLDPGEAETLMSQDIVEIAIEEDRKSQRKTGRLLRVLERGLDTAVGEFKMGAYGPCVELVGKSMELVVPIENKDKAEGIVPGAAVLVKLKYEHVYSATPTAEILKVIGKSLDPGTDLMYIAAKYKFAPDFPQPVLHEAKRIPTRLREEDYADRNDMRLIPFVTIDGPTAKDFDDAVFAERLPHGGHRLLVAVADVAHYVKPKDEIDKEAYRRGTSTYFPNHVIPMLPENLSNGICSINPREDRLAMVCEIEYDRDGTKLRHEFHEAVINSHRRCTYDEIQAFIDHPGSGADFQEGVKNSLYQLNHVFRFLYRNRVARGSVDLDIAETQVVVDPSGEVKGLKKADRWDSHRLIEECMLAANEAVSEFLTENQVPMIFRVHEIPETDAVGKFCEVARVLGANVTRTGVNANQMYQSFLKAIKGLPAEGVLNFLLLRSMKQAFYSSTNYGHFALASSAYTHFTSPIRRYPDLIVHRLLKSFLHARRHGARDRAYSPPSHVLEEMAQQCSRRERHSMEAEREMIRIKQVRYAEKFVGEEFMGTINSMNAKGLFVEIGELAIEGFLEIDRLGYDYQFSDRQMMFQTRKSGRRILLGDKLRVTIARANPHTQRIDLEPTDKVIEHRNRSERRDRDRREPVLSLATAGHGPRSRGAVAAATDAVRSVPLPATSPKRGPEAFLARVDRLKAGKSKPGTGPSAPPKPASSSSKKQRRKQKEERRRRR